MWLLASYIVCSLAETEVLRNGFISFLLDYIFAGSSASPIQSLPWLTCAHLQCKFHILTANRVMADTKAGAPISLKLGDRCIRLLHLVAAKGYLLGTLKTVSLDRSPSFAALSYTWGVDSANPLQHIICSGRKIRITQNCHDALSTLGSTFGVSCSYRMDEICCKRCKCTC